MTFYFRLHRRNKLSAILALAATSIIMIRYSMLFVVVAIIGLFIAISKGLFIGFATSVVPGWHTTIYPPFFWISLAQLIWICLLPLFYFLLEKSKRKISTASFLIHLCCTLMFFLSDEAFVEQLDCYASRIFPLLPILLFAIGQFWFIIILIKPARS